MDVLTFGSDAVDGEIIPLPLRNITAKYREDLCGVCLVAHGEFPSPARWKMIPKPAIMKCEKSQYENELLGRHAHPNTPLNPAQAAHCRTTTTTCSTVSGISAGSCRPARSDGPVQNQGISLDAAYSHGSLIDSLFVRLSDVVSCC